MLLGIEGDSILRRSQQLSALEYPLILEAGSSERVKSNFGEGTVRASVGNKSVPKSQPRQDGAGVSSWIQAYLDFSQAAYTT